MPARPARALRHRRVLAAARRAARHVRHRRRSARTSAPATRCACSTEIQAIPESAIPDKLLDEAQRDRGRPRHASRPAWCIGGRRGHGLMSVKKPDGTWSQPELRQAHRRQHRLPGRRAVVRRGAGVPQRARRWIRSSTASSPSAPMPASPPVRSAATPRPPPMASSRRRSGRGRARAACSPAWRWTARCCRSTTTPTRPSTAAARTPRMIFEGRADAAAVGATGRVPRPAGGSHRARPQQSRHRHAGRERRTGRRDGDAGTRGHRRQRRSPAQPRRSCRTRMRPRAPSPCRRPPDPRIRASEATDRPFIFGRF